MVNTAQFLDSNSFALLAMAQTSRYRQAIDWRRPVQCIVDRFKQTAAAGNTIWRGYSIVAPATAGPNGIAWEFTAQAVLAMRFVDRLYGETRFELEEDSMLAQIRAAQLRAPFADGRGLVASTLDGGDTAPLSQQCLSTPFQCIAQRVGLAATAWAILAEQGVNPFLADLRMIGASDLDRLFDWAEFTFPSDFPAAGVAGTFEPYIYRYYPGKGNYLGFAGGNVFLHNGANWILLNLGPLAPYLALLSATVSDAAARAPGQGSACCGGRQVELNPKAAGGLQTG